MSNYPADYPNEINQETFVIIDNEPLSQDCLAEAMRGEFPHIRIIGIPTVRDLYRPANALVKAVLVKIQSGLSEHHDLAHDIGLISRHFPQVPVIVISARDDASSIEAAVSAGAQGVIPITASFKIAVAALRLVLAGGVYYPRPLNNHHPLRSKTLDTVRPSTAALPPDIMARPVPRTDIFQLDLEGGKEPDGFNPVFTARELDVLTALQQGRSNKWIAHHLNLSENTIKVHIRHIMRKLNATNRTEAVVLSKGVAAGGSNNVNRA